MLKIIKNQSNLVLLVAFILLVGLSFTGCDNGGVANGDETDTKYTLTIEVEGEGTVKPQKGSHEYDDGATAILEVTPDEGYEFKEWAGENGDEIEYDSEDDVYKLLMDSDKEVTAHFVEKDPIATGEMVLVEAGSKGGVTVDNDFYIGKYHVTQAEFEAVMGFNPSYFNDNDHPNLTGNSDNRPVERVTWYDAIKYANELSEIEGFDKYYNISDIEYDGDNIVSATVIENTGANGYRMPTADEHEYTAKGGKDGNSTTYAGGDNLDEVGWYEGNSDASNSDRSDNRGTMPVREKEANELGLYDMSGNVWDWTNTASGSNRIMRGGSWRGSALYCEVEYTYSRSLSDSRNRDGFRLTRSP